MGVLIFPVYSMGVLIFPAVRGSQGFLAGLDHGVYTGLFHPGEERLELVYRVVQQRRVQVVPGERVHAEEFPGAPGQAGQHRFQVDDKDAEQVQAQGAYLLQFGRSGVGPGHLPGLVPVDILVRPVGQGHDPAHGAGVFPGFIVCRDGLGGPGEFLQQRLVVHGRGQLPAEAFVDEPGAAAGDVHHLAHQVGVHALAEILQVEVDVVHAAARLGGEVIAQVLRVQVLQVGAGIDEGAPGLGHFLAVGGEEAVHEHVVGQAVAATVQQGRPEQGMEVHDVLADEVVHLGAAAGADVLLHVPALPVQQVLQAGEIAHGGVHPHVEILARRAGYLEAEIRRIPGDVPFPQPGVEPFVQLVGDLRLQVPGADPVAQHGFKRRQIEEVMLGFLFHGCRAGDGRYRVDKVRGGVGAVAGLATVAVLVLGAAERAFAADEAVRQEHFLYRVVELRDGAALDMACGVEAGVDVLRELPVFPGMGGMEVVEADPEAGVVAFVFGVDAADQLFRGNALAVRAQHDGRAVGVIRADVQAVVAAQLLEAHPDIRLDRLQQVPDMDRGIRIGQCARDKDFTSWFRHCDNLP